MAHLNELIAVFLWDSVCVRSRKSRNNRCRRGIQERMQREDREGTFIIFYLLWYCNAMMFRVE